MEYLKEKCFVNSGSTSNVELCFSEKQNDLVILKTFTLEAPTCSSIRETSFFSTFGVVKHPNIINAYDTWIDTYTYIVLQEEGVSLSSFYRPKMPVEQIQRISYGVLCGLIFLHDNQIVHGDLSSNNILCRGDNVKIIDFGLSQRLIDSPRKLERVVCSIWYRAPENLLECAHYDTSADIWSFGCILALMCRNRHLFSQDDFYEMLKAQLNTVGSPTLEEWMDMHNQGSSAFTRTQYMVSDQYKTFSKLENLFEGSECLNLLTETLCIVPNNRVTARQALLNPFFDTIRKEKDLYYNIVEPPVFINTIRNRKELKIILKWMNNALTELKQDEYVFRVSKKLFEIFYTRTKIANEHIQNYALSCIVLASMMWDSYGLSYSDLDIIENVPEYAVIKQNMIDVLRVTSYNVDIAV